MITTLLLLAAQSSQGDWQLDQLKRRIDAAPAAITRFIERRAMCNHFAGEFNGTGDERDRMILKEMEKLRCDMIDRDEQLLRKEQGKDPAVLELLDETRDLPAL